MQVTIERTKPVREIVGRGDGDGAVGVYLTRLNLHIDLRVHAIGKDRLPAERSIYALVLLKGEVLTVLLLFIEADDAKTLIVDTICDGLEPR